MKEIIKGIIAEMREFIENPTIGTKTESEVKLENYLKGCMKDYADRIEEVVAKMETTTSTCKDSLQVGNAAKMREALLKILDIVDRLQEQTRYTLPPLVYNEILDLKQIAKAALSAPPRNCDVGTAEQQYARFNKFCFNHRSYEKGCDGCPFLDKPCCELAWAQMPYEEVK